ncbi:hypothetical protein Cgig2_030898 [Carnegiea gigantea]|uniref:Small auxin up regulated protein n=1 Tax=Carnegiea gigantea TaxID=171969 RepID=A0A9Q1GP51_9CARY|nr:hypothetical protein Cgig2_030898 [Carnegiea gigantea]
MTNAFISKKNKKMVKIKTAMEKLQRSLQLGKKFPTSSTSASDADVDDGYEAGIYGDNSGGWVPKDVKEGHFAVVAVDEEYGLAKRFVVPLRCLTHPTFLALLERAAEEYGFDHGGALTIPCRLSEMERILAEGWEKGRGPSRKVNWRTMLTKMYVRIIHWTLDYKTLYAPLYYEEGIKGGGVEEGGDV